MLKVKCLQVLYGGVFFFSACLICPLSNLCAGRSPSTCSSTSPTGPIQSPPDVLAPATRSTSARCPNLRTSSCSTALRAPGRTSAHFLRWEKRAWPPSSPCSGTWSPQRTEVSTPERLNSTFTHSDI